MLETAKRFRHRAIDCRNLAKSARSNVDAAMLEELADELLEEAQKIDAEEARARLRPMRPGYRL
jgi:ribosomal protein S7